MTVLTALPAAAAVAAPNDPALRRSEQIDLRRLGKVSEDERAVLRIEWRVGLSGTDEARSVEDMLERLRRMEGSIASIGLVVRNMPVQKAAAPVVDAVAPVAESTNDHDLRLTIANIAAAGLVALWWFRRRKSVSPEPSAAKSDMAPEAREPRVVPPRDEVPVAVAPTRAPLVVDLPREPAAAPTLHEPTESRASVAPLSSPTPSPAEVPPDAEAMPAPAPVEPPAAQAMVIDFSLEEFPPESAPEKSGSPPAATPARSSATAAGAPAERNVEPTLQLAEIMLSMGLEQGAAQALVEYTEANPRHALYHWLKLLGIYRKRGLHKEFAETAEKLRLNFNIQAEDWAQTGTGEAPSLEKFSRVAEHVQKIWVQPTECIDYLQRLLADNRDGERAGFPQAVAEEMLLLIEILKQTSGVDQSVAG